jgi:pimeloyl-ACP methyl ester carboxylesterase
METDTTRLRARTVRVEDLGLHLSELGAGRPVVWLHGSGPASSALGTFGERLAVFAEFRNLMIDLPGFGGSDRPPAGEPMIPQASRCVAALLDELETGPTTVVGNASGGGVAFQLAATRPDLVQRVVAISAGGAFPRGWAPSEALQLLPRYMAAPEPSRELMAQIYRSAVHDPGLISEELLDARMEEARRTHPPESTPTPLGDVNPYLVDVKCPTLLLWGRDDRFLGLDVATHVASQLPVCELRVLSQCGHWVHTDQPQRFERYVGEFLRS